MPHLTGLIEAQMESEARASLSAQHDFAAAFVAAAPPPRRLALRCFQPVGAARPSASSDTEEESGGEEGPSQSASRRLRRRLLWEEWSEGRAPGGRRRVGSDGGLSALSSDTEGGAFFDASDEPHRSAPPSAQGSPERAGQTVPDVPPPSMEALAAAMPDWVAAAVLSDLSALTAAGAGSRASLIHLLAEVAAMRVDVAACRAQGALAATTSAARGTVLWPQRRYRTVAVSLLAALGMGLVLARPRQESARLAAAAAAGAVVALAAVGL